LGAESEALEPVHAPGVERCDKAVKLSPKR